VLSVDTVADSENESRLGVPKLIENFNAAYSAEDWDGAAGWARELVAVKEIEFGDIAPELIVSLANLAAVELELKDWDSALGDAQRGLDIAQSQSGDYLSQQIALLMILARAELGLQNPGGARDTLETVLRYNKKIKPADHWAEADAQQLLVEVALRQADRLDGNRATQKSLKARREYFGGEVAQMAPYYEEAAGWFRASSQFLDERKHHELAMEVLIAQYGESDARLAVPLMGVAATYMIPHKSPKKVRATLERALELDYPDSSAGAILRGRVLANLADYYIVFDDPSQGVSLYRDAWRTMADDPDIGEQGANQVFAAIRRLYFDMPENPANSGKGEDYFREGFIELGFDVSADGRLVNVVVKDSSPKDMSEKLFFKAAKKARYRPRVVDGEPVVTVNQQFRQTYEYDDR
jgi:TonB family protein